MKGLPVIAIAIEALSSARVIAPFSEASDCGPNVLGRLWSMPLSIVIRESVPLYPNAARSISRRYALVTTSSGAPSGNFIVLTSLIVLRPLL